MRMWTRELGRKAKISSSEIARSGNKSRLGQLIQLIERLGIKPPEGMSDACIKYPQLKVQVFLLNPQ